MSKQTGNIKFYAYSKKENKENKLFCFKIKGKFEAIDKVPSILRSFDRVRAIYFEDSTGYNVKLWSAAPKG